jgi:chromosome partitioning protein
MDRPGEDASVPRESGCDMGEFGGGDSGGADLAGVDLVGVGPDAARHRGRIAGAGTADAAAATQADLAGADVGLADLARMAERAGLVVDRLRGRVFGPGAKRLALRFTLAQAAAMAGRPGSPLPQAAILKAEAEGRLRAPETGAGGRRAYELAAVNAMRALFGTLPWRAPDERALVLAVQSFKGGVGKTSLTCHLAQYLALKGYRVCVVDCDSQASATSLFGLNPDADIDEETETLYPFFRRGGPPPLDYALRPTCWPGIALIPANLGLYDAEYEFAARLMQGSGRALERLREGLDTIRDRFDVILVDPPPALGMISLSVLRAADALLIPAPPNNIDFASTGHFLRMMVATLSELSRAERTGGPASAPAPGPAYRFVRIVTTKLNEAKGAHLAIKRMMDGVFPAEMLRASLCESAEIDNAAAKLMTVYELSGAVTRSETHRRCRASLDAVGAEVEGLIRATWPSHRQRLQEEPAPEGPVHEGPAMRVQP